MIQLADISLPAGALPAAAVFSQLRLLSAFLFAGLPLALLAAAALLRRRRAGRATALAISGSLLAAVGGWAFLIEPRWLEVERFTISSPKLPRPLRVVVVADLQTDDFGDYERQALRRVMAERGDLILFTGDYVQEHDPARYAAQAAAFSAALREVGIAAPLGVYAVRGDVDRDDWAALFAGSGVATFEQTTRLELADLTLTALRSRDSRNHLARIPPSDKFHLVFGHAPDFALDDPPAELLVAGHTHGGQVRLPFWGPLVTFSEVPRAWAAGHTEISPGRHLVVSRGIGMERGAAPRLRFLCRPQIVVVDLAPQAALSAG